jgi:hypothetical protein
MGISTLVGIVVACLVHAARIAIGFPVQNLGEVGEVMLTKSIVIIDAAPYHQSAFGRHIFNACDVFVRNVFINYALEVAELPRAQSGGRFDSAFRQIKVESGVDRKLDDCCFNDSFYVMGRSHPVINYSGLTGEFEVIFPILVRRPTDNNRDIRSHLSLPELSLSCCHLSSVFDACGHGGRNTFHGGGGSSSFGDGCLHVASLVSGNLVHLVDSLLQPSGLDSEYNQLKEAYKGENASEPYHSGIGSRFLLSICLFLGGFLSGKPSPQFPQFRSEEYLVGLNNRDYTSQLIVAITAGWVIEVRATFEGLPNEIKVAKDAPEEDALNAVRDRTTAPNAFTQALGTVGK